VGCALRVRRVAFRTSASALEIGFRDFSLCGFAGVWKTRHDYNNAFFESYWRLEAVLTLTAFSAGLGFSIYALFWAH
jgi:hypothetical protein